MSKFKERKFGKEKNSLVKGIGAMAIVAVKGSPCPELTSAVKNTSSHLPRELYAVPACPHMYVTSKPYVGL